MVRIGAAAHSVRAVPVDGLEVVAGYAAAHGLPFHVHLSEQVAENEAAVAATGRSPTGLLAEAGALGPTTSVVHATHLADADVSVLGDAAVSVVACPTTEADLGDGLGPFAELSAAGSTLAVGTDQQAVIDLFVEARAIEYHDRLRLRRRGVHSPTSLLEAATVGGARAVGTAERGLTVGRPCRPGGGGHRGSDPGRLVAGRRGGRHRVRRLGVRGDRRRRGRAADRLLGRPSRDRPRGGPDRPGGAGGAGVSGRPTSTVLVDTAAATMAENGEPYGLVDDAALVITDGAISWVGHRRDLEVPHGAEVRSLGGRLVTPGLIDCHTHLVFGGDRSGEFERRLAGAGYAEIAAAGGGIRSTVRATREASSDELLASARQRLDRIHRSGASTVEVKSGYGLDLDSELRMLTVAPATRCGRPG